jgi:hypothetical protein
MMADRLRRAGARIALSRLAPAPACRLGRCSVIPRIACATTVCLFLVPTGATASDAVALAASLVGRPYVWGAEGPNTFDCSGLTQYVYQEFGVELPRRAVSQSKVGDRIGTRLRRGDLLFFSTDTRRSVVTHVGIYEGAGIMIDASQRHGRVRRDDIRERYWADRFMFGRRVAAAGRDAPTIRTGRRGPARGRTAIRVLETLADVLIRRPGR